MPTGPFAIQVYIKSPLLNGDTVPINQTVSVGVRVKNISSGPLWIVGVLDGSEVGLRYPHYLPSIEGPDYEMLKPEWPDFTSPLRKKDFRLLQPGEDFDPTAPTNGAAYMPLIAFRDFVPLSAGRYHISLTLSTESANIRQWLGTLPYATQNDLTQQVEKVPRCKVVSDLLTFEAR